eukprot:TRINITY_DN3826_c0_g3_i1.p1 TRINITY_DN3826_c0_g3~~TRINITY_DN3826_c0_g3_i1.p1  ORF type:complete len:240 (-),score=-15.64 TRINITY_DN3826_c0_g3_i1:183-902(-)
MNIITVVATVLATKYQILILAILLCFKSVETFARIVILCIFFEYKLKTIKIRKNYVQNRRTYFKIVLKNFVNKTEFLVEVFYNFSDTILVVTTIYTKMILLTLYLFVIIQRLHFIFECFLNYEQCKQQGNRFFHLIIFQASIFQLKFCNLRKFSRPSCQINCQIWLILSQDFCYGHFAKFNVQQKVKVILINSIAQGLFLYMLQRLIFLVGQILQFECVLSGESSRYQYTTIIEVEEQG